MELISEARRVCQQARIAVLLLPGIGTVNELKEAMQRGAQVVRITKRHYDLMCHGVPDIVEYFLDLRQGDFLWIIVDIHVLCRDGHLDGTYALQFSDCSFNGVLAVLTRNVGSYKRG